MKTKYNYDWRPLSDAERQARIECRTSGILSIHPDPGSVMSARMSMFAGHTSNVRTIEHPEWPILGSGKERNLGNYSLGYIVEDDKQNFTILEVFDKFRSRDCVLGNSEVGRYVLAKYDAVCQLSGKVKTYLTVFEINPYEKVNMKFATRTRETTPIVKGKVFGPGERLTYSSNFDTDSESEMLGVNLVTMACSHHYGTEDSIGIRESALEKLSSPLVDVVRIPIDVRDIPLQIHGQGTRKSFIPKIGDFIHPDGIVAAIRKRTKFNALRSLTKEAVQNSKVVQRDGNDLVFEQDPKYRVIDVNFHLGKEWFPVKKNSGANMMEGAQQELDNWLNDQYAQQRKLYFKLEEIFLRFGYEFDDNAALYMSNVVYNFYDIAKLEGIYRGRRKDDVYIQKLQELTLNKLPVDVLRSNVTKSDALDKVFKANQEFSYLMVELTLIKKYKGNLGLKLTGRSGDKSIECYVIPDEEAPYDPVTGIRADVIANDTAAFKRVVPFRPVEPAITASIEHHVMRCTEQYKLGTIDFEEVCFLIEDWYRKCMPHMVHPFDDQEGNPTNGLIMDGEDIDREYVKYLLGGGQPYLMVQSEMNMSPEIMLNNVMEHYPPDARPIYLFNKSTGQWELTKDNVLLGKIYTIPLDKISVEISAANTPKLTVFSTAAKPTPKDKSTRLDFGRAARMSEADMRLMYNICDAASIAEWAERGGDYTKQLTLCQRILESPTPTGEDCYLHPEDSKVQRVQGVINNVLNTGAGLRLVQQRIKK